MSENRIDIVENYLSNQEADYIESEMLGAAFPWFLNEKIVEESGAGLLNYQFTHTFYRNHGWSSDYAHLVFPIIAKINPLSILKIKANLNPVTENHHYGGWHTDYEIDCKTAVYYVNTNNGFTELESGEKLYSQKNKFVNFDSRIRHSGVSTTDTRVRCVININYI